MLRATVSGSFRRHMAAIYDAVTELLQSGVKVLSPADPRVVDQIGDFLFVASDRVRSVRMVEDRHLESIRSSDFLWLVSPDGYVGQSASLELGFAIAFGIPVFSSVIPGDLTLRQYVHPMPDIRAAIAFVKGMKLSRQYVGSGFLLDPLSSIQIAQEGLESIQRILAKAPREIDEDAARNINAHRDRIRAILSAKSEARSALV